MTQPIQIRTFRAKSLSEALARIRRELGPDAVILETKPATKSILGLGNNRISVTATSNTPSHNNPSNIPQASDQQAAESQASTETPLQASDRLRIASLGDLSSASSGDDSLSSTSDLANCDDRISPEQLPSRFIRSSGRKRTRDDSPPFTGPYLEFAAELAQTDLDRDLIHAWMLEANEILGDEVTDSWVIRALIAQWIRSSLTVSPSVRDWEPGRERIACIGPAGHGKTNCVAKLAGLVSQSLGWVPGIVSCNAPGTNSTSRLAEYCSMMNWPYGQADSPKVVPSILQQMESCDILLIDAHCGTICDVETRQKTSELLTSLGTTQTHLVMSATLSAVAFRRALEWYESYAPTDLLMTKLDEACGLSAIYLSLTQANLPLGFISTGHRIPSDFLQLDSGKLIQCILGI
ncbi:MAG: hypothetical protein FJ308_02530 [Planctomycetes bacterium]|nr:hypothetical protein [Planctomycetota bacterium]